MAKWGASQSGGAAGPHAGTHADGGSDQLDITQLDGYPGGTSLFLRADQIFSVPAGGGDVAGPASSVDGRVASFDGTTGKVIDDSGVAASDLTELTGGGATTLHSHAVSHAAATGQTANDHHNQQHAFAGADHTASSLSDVNSKVNDANLDDASAPRTPTAHAASHAAGQSDEISITDLGVATLAAFNSAGVISDANLDATGAPRPPTAHALSHADGGADEIQVEDLATTETDTDLVLKPDGSGGLAFGEAPSSGGGGGLSSQQFGGRLIALGENFRKGAGASTDNASADISQLTSWVVPEEFTLKHLVVTSNRSTFAIAPVIGVFVGSSLTPAVSVTLSSMAPLPTSGTFQSISLGDTVIAAGSVVTIRQTAGTTIEFFDATVYWQ